MTPRFRSASVAGAVSVWLPALVLAVGLAGAGAWRYRQRELDRRSHAYDALIRDAAQRHCLSPFLVKAVIWKESRFDHLAVGRKGEVGLMQITDAAVAEWSRRTGRRLPCRGLRFLPRLNIEIGTWYLAWTSNHWREYRSAEELALAEYNAGYGNVMKYGWPPESPQTRLDPKQISFPATREYINRVLMKWHQFEKEHRKREQ